MCDVQYQEIVQRFADVVYRTALNATKSYYDAQDIVQNTFLKLWQTDTVFENDDHIRRWLIRVTVNESKNLKKSYYKRMVDSIDKAEEIPAFSDERDRDLYEAVASMPPKFKIAVHLFYYEDYTTEEIADLLCLSPAAVRTRLFRARQILKKLLTEDE